MVEKNLGAEAKNVIESYLHLPIPGHDFACPYYNNRRQRVRGALRVLVGKGSIHDIAEEVRILSLKEKINLKDLSSAQLKKFLVDHHVGIDCSALAYYILDAELRTRNKGPLQKKLRWPNGGLFRRLLCKLRPVESTSVDTLADDRNSFIVTLKDIQSGDFIIMQGFGQNHDRDHVVIVHEVERPLPNPPLIGEGHPSKTSSPYEGEVRRGSTTIHYTHSLQWSTDGKYNHGVRQGKIEITDPQKSLIEQAWTEQGVTGEQNETWRHARDSQRLEIRRLRAMV